MQRPSVRFLRRSQRGLAAALALATTTLTLPAWAAAEKPADVVFRNGAVYTVDPETPWADAVAVRGDRIVYVGTGDGLKPFIGPKTRVVDIGKGMLLPGFVDSHTHLSSTETIDDVALTLRERPASEVVERFRQYVAEHPNQKLILGSGWIYEAFPKTGPTKEMIDPFTPDVPVVLKAIDGHHMWVNSKALEIAGIDKNFPDPLPGRSWYQRDPATHEPTGFVVEGRAMLDLQKLLIAKGYAFDTRERIENGLNKGLPLLAQSGITTIFDAGMRDPDTTFEVLHNMERAGTLGVRVFGSYVYRPDLRPDDPTDPVAAFQVMRQRYHSDKLGMGQIKTYLDGTETNHTGFMLEPFVDRPEWRGEPLVPTPLLNSLLERADAAGIDVHMHVVGDAAARQGLDAVERAIAINGPRVRRHTLAHTILVDPADFARFRQLGVIWQTTPAWAVMNDRNRQVQSIIGDQRFNWIYPLQSVADQSVIIASGSDMTGMGVGAIWKPLDEMEIGHNRQPMDHPNTPVMPTEEQRLNLDELIRSYTINGAYMLRREHDIGSIRVGKKADMVLLERNLFEVPRYELHNVATRMTLMDGKPRYEAKP